MNATKEDILASGLRIVNARGLSALTIRAVAEDLELSPGNVSYHFRRKEDLVAALVARLGAGNASRLGREIGSLGELFEMFRELFRNQYEHRGLVLALPDVIETFEQIRADYRKSELVRRRTVFALLAALRARGALSGSDRELSRLVSHVTLIARFWIGEARVSYGKHGQQRIVAHYLALIADTLLPYTTEAHRAELESYRDGWIDSLEITS
jgi:AcrR family transcriptional regulator